MSYLTPEEIGEILKVPADNVLKWIKAGVLKAVKIDGIYRINEEEFKEFITSLNRNQRSTEEIILLRQKTNAYFILVEWLQVEIQMLSEIYRDLEHVLEHTVEHLKGNLDNHRKSGDHHNERYIGQYLLQVFDHWEKPRQSYQDWMHKYENRWYQFQDNYLPHINKNENLDLYFHHSEWPQFYKYNQTMGVFPTRAQHQVKSKNEYYHKKYIWLKKELDDLCRHYHKFNRTIKKIIGKLFDARKKCSKEMDFKKGYLIHEIITMLYLHLEKPRKKYNYWLMGKEERWQEFKSRNISRLREIDELNEVDTLNSFSNIDTNNNNDKLELSEDIYDNKVSYNHEYSKSMLRDDEEDYNDEFDEL